MNGIILYYSRYNTTKQYAQWLSEEMECEAVPVSSYTKQLLENKDYVVLGCSVMANRPKLRRWIVKKWKILKGKKVFLFTTSGAPGDDPGLQKGFSSSFPIEITSHVKYFPFSGRLIFSKLKGMDKFFMRIGQMIEKDPAIKAEMVKDVDRVNRDEIKPLVNELKLL